LAVFEMAQKKRSVGSIKTELVQGSRDAALTAIRTFNDPHVSFKSETFVVLMMIAWTYLLHAYYRSSCVEYRYYSQGVKRRKFDRTKNGAYKYWELERCLNDKASPIDKDTANNLRFLIGLRHEVEHQMTINLDNWLSGRYQACALNFNFYVKKLFGEQYGLDQLLAFSIQFADLTPDHEAGQKHEKALPQNFKKYIAEFDGALDHDEYNDPRFSYRMLFKRKLVNRPGQADKVIEFIDPKSELAKVIDKEFWVRKEVERQKFRASDVVDAVKRAGFTRFRVFAEHMRMWKAEDAKKTGKGYGVEIQGAWYWYQSWIDRCIELCEAAGNEYR
jgi:hypothetical protein